MSKRILGEASAYQEAMVNRGKNIEVSASLIIEMSERIRDLEMAVIDLKANLRTCQNTINYVIDPYEDL